MHTHLLYLKLQTLYNTNFGIYIDIYIPIWIHMKNLVPDTQIKAFFWYMYNCVSIVFVGSGHGIGAGTALEFAQLAKLVITARNKSALDRVERQCRENGASQV